MKKPTYQELERKIKELEALSGVNTRAALHHIGKAGDHLMASAVIVHLTALGGREIVKPFAIRDGFSVATIEAIRKDIQHSMRLAGYQP
jgi:hypothetical protein